MVMELIWGIKGRGEGHGGENGAEKRGKRKKFEPSGLLLC